MKNRHPLSEGHILRHREMLLNTDFETGFLYLMNQYAHLKNIQERWLQHVDLYLKYEDLIENELETFQKIIDHCQLNISIRKIKDILSNNSFEKKTGRIKGQVDQNHHLRSGLPGDWKNYFSSNLKQEFKKKFGNTLISTGYEMDLSW